MRNIQRNTAILTLGLLISAACSAKADVQITLGSETYGVTVVSGTFQSLMTQLEAQPEWGNVGLAVTIATDVGGKFGLPNFSAFGPVFAYESNPNVVPGPGADTEALINGSIGEVGVDFTGSFDFGILTDEGSVAAPDAPSFLTNLSLFLPLLGFGLRKHLFQRHTA